MSLRSAKVAIIALNLSIPVNRILTLVLANRQGLLSGPDLLFGCRFWEAEFAGIGSVLFVLGVKTQFRFVFEDINTGC